MPIKSKVKSRAVAIVAMIAISLTILVMCIALKNETFTRVEKAENINDELHYAISTEHEICTSIARKVMEEEQANAIEAAIAALFCIGTVNPFSSGIGGGGVAMVRDENMQIHAMDFREMSSSSSTFDIFATDPSKSVKGALSVGVPGEVKGLWELYQRFGLKKAEWNTLIEPSIQLARNGFTVDRELARRIQIYKSDILEEPTLRQVFAPEGQLLGIGDTLQRPNYAQTLETISKEGANAFYSGSIATSLIKFIQSNGGILTADDFKNYSIKMRDVVQGEFNGLNVYSMGPPASGNIVVTMLNVLNQFDDKEPHPVTYYHSDRLVECMKFGYGIRNLMGDADFNDGMSDFVNSTTDETFAKRINSLINDAATYPMQYYTDTVTQALKDQGTTHVSVIDRNGLSASITSSINHIFGSKLIDPTTGILLNNVMDDFSQPTHPNAFMYPPNPSNYIEPRKRPQSSMAPLIIEKQGKVFMSVGASGGAYMPSAVFQSVVNVLVRRMLPQMAVNEPRVHHQLNPDVVRVEVGFDRDILNGLTVIGHTVEEEGPRSAVQMAMKIAEFGGYEAGADERKHGYAISQ
ncbi:gamma-glutamyltranspeptidase [Rozella allomycis CSF55]|uniref:Glutathione hydrolase n=1 Tax=Rozella allomycis (strain CSF55) TaxID=988480 RepID=A0A4P9YGJ3_ROZAC|nr:gamma-glutamyltranspeptidase [Rozella allomycis CSF55]